MNEEAILDPPKIRELDINKITLTATQSRGRLKWPVSYRPKYFAKSGVCGWFLLETITNRVTVYLGRNSADALMRLEELEKISRYINLMSVETLSAMEQVVHASKYIATGGSKLLCVVLVIIERHHLTLTEAVSLLQDRECKIPKTEEQVYELIMMIDQYLAKNTDSL